MLDSTVWVFLMLTWSAGCYLPGVVTVKLLTFFVVSAGIVFLSWKPMRRPRSHGFFRFFTFEIILALFLLNVDHWFRDPFSALHILSWILLLLSLVTALHGFYLLRYVGKPKEGIENTTVLVVRGLYKYVRHPLYTSLLLLGWGIFLKDVSIFSIALALVTTGFLVVTARTEEAENLKKFGAEYATYMKRTKMFIPFLI